MERLPHLDGVRGLAICLVICCHVTLATWWGDGSGISSAVEWITASGVDLFFVLSGLLISGILLDLPTSKTSAKTFYIRRILRIVPLYYAVLIFFGLILHFFYPEGHGFGGEWLPHPLSHILFLSNISYFLDGVLPRSPVSISWSLAIEEHFYLVWPVIVFSLSRRYLYLACFAVVLIALVIRFALVANGANDNQIMIFTFSRMDTFAFGCLLSLVWRDKEKWTWWQSYMLLGVGLGLGGGLVIYLAMELWPGTRLLLLPLIYLVANIGFTALIGKVLATPQVLGGVFCSSLLRSFGRYSYAIYLTNLAVTFGLILLFGEPTRWLGGSGPVFFYPLVFLLCWLLGYVLFHAIEYPFLKLKRHFPYPAGK